MGAFRSRTDLRTHCGDFCGDAVSNSCVFLSSSIATIRISTSNLASRIQVKISSSRPDSRSLERTHYLSSADLANFNSGQLAAIAPCRKHRSTLVWAGNYCFRCIGSPNKRLNSKDSKEELRRVTFMGKDSFAPQHIKENVQFHPGRDRRKSQRQIRFGVFPLGTLGTVGTSPSILAKKCPESFSRTRDTRDKTRGHRTLDTRMKVPDMNRVPRRRVVPDDVWWRVN
jgi:hypothetical protein